MKRWRIALGKVIEPIVSTLIFILIVIGIFYVISIPIVKLWKETNKCYLTKVPYTYQDEKVKSLTYGHSFLEGNYCVITTNKDIYTIYDQDCVRNKIGKALTFSLWENTCK
jgi:hypothetical protein